MLTRVHSLVVFPISYVTRYGLISWCNLIQKKITGYKESPTLGCLWESVFPKLMPETCVVQNILHIIKTLWKFIYVCFYFEQYMFHHHKILHIHREQGAVIACAKFVMNCYSWRKPYFHDILREIWWIFVRQTPGFPGDLRLYVWAPRTERTQ